MQAISPWAAFCFVLFPILLLSGQGTHSVMDSFQVRYPFRRRYIGWWSNSAGLLRTIIKLC